MQDRRPVRLVRIGSPPGPVVEVLTLGALVHNLEITCGDGRRRNVVLGHATIAERLASSDYIGGTIGRYANRTAGGRFLIEGRTVVVQTHDRATVSTAAPTVRPAAVGHRSAHRNEVLLSLVSPDGDQSFPGTVTAHVRYRVEQGAVHIEMTAATDAPTVVNLTNHAYLNLDGEGAGTIDGHLLSVEAHQYTPVDSTGIPVGGHAPVTGRPFDLREPRPIGQAVRTAHPQILHARPQLRGTRTGMRAAATLESPGTRTRVELPTDRSGLHVYTGNFLDGSRRSTAGWLYRQGDGVALEPAALPRPPNHPQWPSAVLGLGQQYAAALAWAFPSTSARP